MNRKLLLAFSLMSAIAAVPQFAVAAQNSCNSSSCTAPVNLDFQVVIGGVLRFRVGSAVAVDTITFTPAVADLGNSSAVAGAGGDLGTGVVTVQIISNLGGSVRVQTSLTNPANGLTDGGGPANFIPWGEIDTAATANVSPAPVLQNGSVTDQDYAPNAGAVVNRTGTWTYTYANTTVPPQGTYTGTATYTAVDL